MKVYIRHLLLTGFALLLLLAASNRAAADIDQENYARQLAWEHQTGRQSAITIYFSMFDIPEMPDPIEQQVNQFLDGKPADEKLIESWLNENYWDCFEKVRQGAKLKDTGRVNDLNHPPIDLEEVSRGLAAYATLEAQKGGAERGWSDLMACARMGYALQDQGAGFGSFVLGMSCRHKSAWGISRFLLSQRPTPQQAAQYAAALQEWRAHGADYLKIYRQGAEWWLEDYKQAYTQGILQDPKDVSESERQLMAEIRKPSYSPQQVRADCQYVVQLTENFARLTPAARLAHFREERKKADDYLATKPWHEHFKIVGVDGGSLRMWTNDDLTCAREQLTATAALIRASHSADEIQRILQANPDPYTGKPYEYQKQGYRPFHLRSAVNLHDYFSDVKDHNLNLEVIQFGEKAE